MGPFVRFKLNRLAIIPPILTVLSEYKPRNNLPKQFCERCFEEGDRKSQQNELELVLELDIGVCGRKECMGAGISGGGPPWAHKAGGAPKGVGRALHPRGQVLAPPDVFSLPDILKNSRKNHIPFSGHLENFYFRGNFILHR